MSEMVLLSALTCIIASFWYGLQFVRGWSAKEHAHVRGSTLDGELSIRKRANSQWLHAIHEVNRASIPGCDERHT